MLNKITMLLVRVRILLIKFSFHEWSVRKTIYVKCIGLGRRLVSSAYAVFIIAISVVVSWRIPVWYQVAVRNLGTAIYIVTATRSRVGGRLVVYDLAHLVKHANALRTVAHDARFTCTKKQICYINITATYRVAWTITKHLTNQLWVDGLLDTYCSKFHRVLFAFWTHFIRYFRTLDSIVVPYLYKHIPH